MSNMSYCRFTNTAGDVSDCLHALDPYENEHEISDDEIAAGRQMFQKFLDYCVENDIVEDYDREQVKAVFEEHNAEIRRINGDGD